MKSPSSAPPIRAIANQHGDISISRSPKVGASFLEIATRSVSFFMISDDDNDDELVYDLDERELG